ncbi:hypothetical protein [Altererythrobacter sp. GH1-8]|uniref:hypothetical protein n=1 Tax=Altererythrobacter sp. GH1-8 TaxID=3349333 RepID=UPI00374D251F
MSNPDPAGLKPHDLAKTEIEAWRGRCLNIFARGEKAVTESLASARETSSNLRLEPLAGQRLNTLAKLDEDHCSTEKQKAALRNAVALWREHDEKRPYFSHGITAEFLDRKGEWHVQIDFVAVQKGACEPQRLIWSKQEAETFEASLQNAFNRLAVELGQLRKRLKP